MKKKTGTWKLLSAMLVLCLSLTCLAFAGEETPKEPAEPETVAKAPLQIKTLGPESEDAFQIEITNNTGKDIEYVGIALYDPDPVTSDLIYQMQEALINAGSMEREADGNILTEGDVFAAGETRILYVLKMKPAEDAAEGEETPEQAAAAEDGQAADALAEAFREFSLVPEYVLSFRGQGESEMYYLFAFPASSMQTAQLNIDNLIPYVIYTTADSQDPISTLDAEKAASDIFYSNNKNTAVN